MAFPRSFKNETWYMRLPSGEVELVTANVLERAFQCGLVDARTPVRSVAAPVWVPLQEAAELDPGPPMSMTSLSPMALETALSDEEVGARWLVRERDLDPRAVRASRLPILGGALALVAAVAVVALGIGQPTNDLASHVAAANAPMAIEVTSAAPRPSRPDVTEHEHPTRVFDERLTAAQRWKLRDLDYRRRMRGPSTKTQHGVSPSHGALAPKRARH
jgi:hypothetical protein